MNTPKNKPIGILIDADAEIKPCDIYAIFYSGKITQDELEEAKAEWATLSFTHDDENVEPPTCIEYLQEKFKDVATIEQIDLQVLRV